VKRSCADARGAGGLEGYMERREAVRRAVSKGMRRLLRGLGN